MIGESIVVASTPLRISLGGGGTDLPFYQSRFGSDVLAISISPRVVVVGSRGQLDGSLRFVHDGAVYTNHAQRLSEPFVSAAMDMVGFSDSGEIFSIGPVPAGTGLGSSGAFAVGLLAVLNVLKGNRMDRIALIEQACTLEMDRLGRPVGKQDQYICGLGGIRRLIISEQGAVRVDSVDVADSTLGELERRMMLFYTGIRRDSSSQLAVSPKSLNSRISQLHQIRRIGERMRNALAADDLDQVPGLLREHWSIKTGDSHDPAWAPIFHAARTGGATAWKMVGAGGGGFILFWVDPDRREALNSVLESFGLQNLPFRFSRTGATVSVLGADTEVWL
ncbi:GHMP family kinase ATP-binding protein [Nocardia aurea]|uniref:GHMP family kinase ATP-binding protein n=1 Tax=Nocardia aurea TaxID=2144174 RepID=UPI0013009DB2|nr:hypothetical protein [Nocardia aurea]